jgi:hypothetical protein
MSNTAPVENEHSSEHSQATSAATSSTVAPSNAPTGGSRAPSERFAAQELVLAPHVVLEICPRHIGRHEVIDRRDEPAVGD